MDDSPQIITSSDDSDDYYPVQVKKPRSTRTVRCIPQSFLEEQKNASCQANVYTTRVKCVMQELRAGRISAADLGIDDDQDGNDSAPSSEVPKKSKKRGHRKDSSFSSSDEDTENTDTSFFSTSAREDSSFHISASPSPPPSPHVSLAQRPVRMSKVTKTALRNIERAALSLRENEVNLATSFTDIDVICMGEEELRDITVKVEYKGDVRKYTMKRHLTFSLVKSMIAAESNVEESRVMLYNGDKAIHPSDTPASIGLHVADILNCYVDSTSTDKREDYATESNNAITLFIQSRNLRQKMQYTVDRTKPLQYLIDRIASDRSLRASDVRLRFDGEDIFSIDSAMDLELEDGFCLDLMD